MDQKRDFYPGLPVGHLADEDLLALMCDGRNDSHSPPRGELRMLHPMPFGGQEVQVYTIVENQLLWFGLVAPDHRDKEIKRQQHETKAHWQVGDLLTLQKIDRKTLRWYPEGFADAAFQIGELVNLRINDSCIYRAIVQRFVLYHDPDNTIGITTYDLELQLAPEPNQVTRYALEYEIERVTEQIH
jgi:hypothetical protein